MQKISEIVTKHYQNDENAQIALRNGILSITKYAKKLQPLIAQETLKQVKLKSIVVALHRLEAKILGMQKKQFSVKLQNISIHPNLVEVTHEKTKKNLQQLSELSQQVTKLTTTFFAQTSCINEITIILEETHLGVLDSYFTSKPLFYLTNLAGITVKFSQEYLEQPSLIYELTKRLAMNDVNITEVVSTATELTFIVSRDLTERTISLLSKYL